MVIRQIGVIRVPCYSKSVWFSAEVTNIGKTAAPEEHPFGTITPVIRKAYLLDL